MVFIGGKKDEPGWVTPRMLGHNHVVVGLQPRNALTDCGESVGATTSSNITGANSYSCDVGDWPFEVLGASHVRRGVPMGYIQ